MAAALTSAQAADPYGALPAPAISPARIFELRLGVYAHDPVSPEKGSVDFNGEFLIDAFPRDRSTVLGALVPRLHVGGTGNTNGKTSQGYAGLTWTYDITPKIFVEAGFGGAVHNGKTAMLPPVGFNAMGCGWGFHEQGTLGYRFTEAWSVMLTVEHTSNSGICKQNRGLTNLGMRVGYSF
jgi:lipid A 3-O-deacylase